MNKILFAALFLGLFLASCGGSPYTTDKDEALEMGEKLLDDEKELRKELLDDAKDYREKKDELLKDYDGKERKLLKKAKKEDEDALSTLKELRDLKINYELDKWNKSIKLAKEVMAYELSRDDIEAINDKDDIKDWLKDIKKIDEKRSKATIDFYSDLAEAEEGKDDDDDDDEDYGDEDYDDDYRD